MKHLNVNFTCLLQIQIKVTAVYLTITYTLVFPKNTTSPPLHPLVPLTLAHDFPSSTKKRSNCRLICCKLDLSADVIRDESSDDECTVIKFPTWVHGRR
ncbi:hypothetical protein CDAR_233341 [Caerostris darwini]|uniref:Uncharacterized protein n=1 Tax=Caerostris darwini TaxID=1538125 RepID=A0AAV4PPB0_9ARAC|nr:hypothetical protein CDAR_233341 [Caerostris darwini]